MKSLRSSMFIPALSWLLSGCLTIPDTGSSADTLKSFNVCHGFSCRYQTKVASSTKLLAAIDKTMRAGAESPSAERQAIAKSVALFEQHYTARLGIRDKPLSNPFQARMRGQMDCKDESENTRTLLLMLQNRGLLKHHRVRANTFRGFMLDARYFHSTAVISDPSGIKWAVDSWYEPGGGKPDILPLAEWRKRGQFGRR